MKYKKTPYSKRSTHRHYDDDGNLVAEYKVDEEGITEEVIQFMHSLDDHEVYVNCKEMKQPEWYRPIYEKWKSDYIARFTEKYGYAPEVRDIPGGHRQYESIEAQGIDCGEDLGDSSKLAKELSCGLYDESETAVDRARELVKDMPEKWQQVYQMVFVEGMSKTQTGRKMGISDVRVGQIVKKITAVLTADKRLKNFFH